ncbi:MAG: ribonuclease P protein component 4 [Nanoarchaeota archaeon]|nr:ribonuclease P protein component 4 [Nanoarchaeota archaeon]
MVRAYKKKQMQRIADERIKILFNQADSIFSTNPSLANRYVALARKIAMKANISIPRVFKRKFCKHCYKYLKHGINCRVRIKDGKVIYYCKSCKKYMRFPISKKKKSA